MKNLEAARAKFRLWREDNARKSEEAITLFETILADSMHKLGDERWLVYEQVCLAACDCQRIDIIDHCLQELSKEFPGSLRVRKLRADKYISLERYSDALEILDSIIKKDETSAIPRKRKIAVLKAQGKITEAVKGLCDYLEKFQADQEAWLELSELYVSLHEYSKAAFCLEELILHNPANHLYYERYAEIKFAQGGADCVEVAQAYFCQAAKLNPRNLCALRGILSTTNYLLASPKTPATRKKDVLKLQEWVTKHLKVREEEEEDETSQQSPLILLMSDLHIKQKSN